MANSVKTLHKAKKEKNDEFYTQLNDVNNELRHYKDHFKDKTILCNCDDESSAFWEYFHLNFNFFGMKKLIATHYDKEKPTYKVEYTGGVDTDLQDCILTPLKGNGDFRNKEGIELLQEADIVVTNPPFSLFREYVAQLMKYNKKFIIIGNQNAITYNEVFPLLKDNKIWLGASQHKSMSFRTPLKEAKLTCQYSVNGVVYQSFGNICWFTNLEHTKRHEKLILWKTYNPDDYPKYDNYNAIEVKKTDWIPEDYFDEMGVPITFMDKYCPEQFEILDARNSSNNAKLQQKNTMLIKDKDSAINGKPTYARILIKRK